MDSDNTIQAFLLRDSCGKIVKTKKLLEKEQDRVQKVKKARENALNLAMEKSAKQILQERRYQSNTKRFQQQMDAESMERSSMFMTLNDIRIDKHRQV